MRGGVCAASPCNGPACHGFMNVDLPSRVKGVLPKSSRRLKVGRAVPSAPGERVQLHTFRISADAGGALGPARPTPKTTWATRPQGLSRLDSAIGLLPASAGRGEPGRTRWQTRAGRRAGHSCPQQHPYASRLPKRLYREFAPGWEAGCRVGPVTKLCITSELAKASRPTVLASLAAYCCQNSGGTLRLSHSTWPIPLQRPCNAGLALDPPHRSLYGPCMVLV